MIEIWTLLLAKSNFLSSLQNTSLKNRTLIVKICFRVGVSQVWSIEEVTFLTSGSKITAEAKSTDKCLHTAYPI